MTFEFDRMEIEKNGLNEEILTLFFKGVQYSDTFEIQLTKPQCVAIKGVIDYMTK